MGLVYSVSPVVLVWPYLGGRPTTAEAVASSERTELRQNMLVNLCRCSSGAAMLLETPFAGSLRVPLYQSKACRYCLVLLTNDLGKTQLRLCCQVGLTHLLHAIVDRSGRRRTINCVIRGSDGSSLTSVVLQFCFSILQRSIAIAHISQFHLRD